MCVIVYGYVFSVRISVYVCGAGMYVYVGVQYVYAYVLACSRMVCVHTFMVRVSVCVCVREAVVTAGGGLCHVDKVVSFTSVLPVVIQYFRFVVF